MKLLIAGDFCEKLRFSSMLKKEEFAELDAIREITNSVDFSIVNFEFPIVSQQKSPIYKTGPNLFGSRFSVKALKYMGFNVCTLANNHILDQGEVNCLQTQEFLNSQGIKTVGVGNNLSDAQKILYLQKANTVTAIINCCEHEFSIATTKTPGANPINPIAQFHSIIEAKKKADFVIVIVHGGNEHCQLPSKRMKETYRFYIEAGADIVINHHQHCMSGYEIYNGKPIFYGLGNFLFDHSKLRNDKWNKGYMVLLNLKKNTNPMFTLIPYMQANEQFMFKLCDAEEQVSFDKELSNLNEIIHDDTKCQLQYEEWLKSNINEYVDLFEPYSSKITKKLCRLGLLPSFLKKTKLLRIINYINCESHLDKLRFILNEKYLHLNK